MKRSSRGYAQGRKGYGVPVCAVCGREAGVGDPIRLSPSAGTRTTRRADGIFPAKFPAKTSKTKLIYGSVDPNGTGYVYKVKADAFRRVDELGKRVTESPCVPVEITEIKVRDYLHTIEFSEEARRITETLYGSF